MTDNPPALRELVDRIEKQIGPFNAGVIGDDYHFYGYHLGGNEVPADDYSRVLKRDRDGIKKYGGQWAAAIDINMGWKNSRAWLRWLLDHCMGGDFNDVREIIGSLNGKTCFTWDDVGGLWVRELNDHIDHTHISLYRDAVFRSQVALIGTWTAKGPPPSIPVTKTGVRPSSSLSGPFPDVPAETAGDGYALGLGLAAVAATGGALAWLIRRRNQLGG